MVSGDVSPLLRGVGHGALMKRFTQGWLLCTASHTRQFQRLAVDRDEVSPFLRSSRMVIDRQRAMSQARSKLTRSPRAGDDIAQRGSAESELTSILFP